ncbi:alpha-parvin [Eurytemora carolleeae]|uniref:alpha-parvin n=1 Tax=Eurytemora carolleeae TaxID=1294199 RepID=UPI000C782802|nr:alpha-parvin [Eurytemora carolleeae]|eukprot:XP_023335133.1 alpha-parvin-like [Eurytemora affinis]
MYENKTSPSTPTPSIGSLTSLTSSKNTMMSSKTSSMTSLAQPNPLSPRVLTPQKKEKKFAWLTRSEEEEELDILTENILMESTVEHRVELGEDDINIQVGEKQEHLDLRCINDPGVSELIKILINWISAEFSDQRVQITDLGKDLRDGQVYALIYEKILGLKKLDLPWGEYVQSRERQEKNLEFIIENMNRELGLTDVQIKWKTSLLSCGEMLNILRLLIKINRFCHTNNRPAPELPRVIKVNILKLKKLETGVRCERRVENIMGQESEIGKRDGFDTLFDHFPDKLFQVQSSLLTFVNRHLASVGLGVGSLQELADGYKLCILLGYLQGFFIPLYEFHQKPATKDEMIENVELAYRLIKEGGLPTPMNRPGEVVQADLKAIFRIIYSLFLKYK